jgi:hypothetical protein
MNSFSLRDDYRKGYRINPVCEKKDEKITSKKSQAPTSRLIGWTWLTRIAPLRAKKSITIEQSRVTVLT